LVEVCICTICALGLQLGDDRRIEHGLDRTGAMALRLGERGLILGTGGGGGRFCVGEAAGQRGHFLVGERSGIAAGRCRTDGQAIGGLEPGGGIVGLADLLAQLFELLLIPVGLGTRDAGARAHGTLDVMLGKGIGDLCRLDRIVVLVAHVEDVGLLLAGDGQIAQQGVGDNDTQIVLAERNTGLGQFGVLGQLQVIDDALGQAQRVECGHLGLDRFVGQAGLDLARLRGDGIAGGIDADVRDGDILRGQGEHERANPNEAGCRNGEEDFLAPRKNVTRAQDDLGQRRLVLLGNCDFHVGPAQLDVSVAVLKFERGGKTAIGFLNDVVVRETGGMAFGQG
jgi:hypothetical protein